jgi:hypothetical protein
MFEKIRIQIEYTQLSKLVGNLVQCLVIKHTNYNPKVHFQ